MHGVNPLVSVLIPSYNHVTYIEETIDSVIAQEYDNLELIICDDNSSDGTWDIIKQCQEKCALRFKQCIFFQKQHLGIHDSLKRMLQIATGKYIYIIASDDVALPTAIKILCSFLEENETYGLVVGKNEIIDSKSKIVTQKYGSYNLFAAELEEKNLFGDYWQLLHRNHIPNGYLIRKEFFKKFIYNANTYEDYFMMLQISKTYKMKFLNMPLFFYRRHATNTISSKKLHDKVYELDKELILSEQNYCEAHGHIELWAEKMAQFICNCKGKIDLKYFIQNLYTTYPDSGWPKVLLGVLIAKEGNYSKAFSIICDDGVFIKCEDNLIPYIIYIYNCFMIHVPTAKLVKIYYNLELIDKLYFLIRKKKDNLLFNDAYFFALQTIYFLYYLNISVSNVFNCFDTHYGMEKKIIYKLLKKYFSLKNKHSLKNLCELKKYIGIAIHYKLKSSFAIGK